MFFHNVLLYVDFDRLQGKIRREKIQDFKGNNLGF